MHRFWVVPLLAIACQALDIVPANWTSQNVTASNGYRPVRLAVSVGDHSMVSFANILPLTDTANSRIPPPGLSGQAAIAQPSNQMTLQRNNIALISCDITDYGGNIDATDVFAAAEQRNVTSVVFYSRNASGCNVENYDQSYPFIFSMTNETNTETLLGNVEDSSSGKVYLTIGPPGTAVAPNDNATSGSTGSQGPGGPLGPSPSTTVAMIVLYSITGVITALFLIIIVTGAVRAHRHPERYGPRNTVGRPRQSRAKGLAKAMLDSLPIVKVAGDDKPKPAEVELENGTVSASSAPASGQDHASNSGTQQGELSRETVAEEDGIAAATSAAVVTPAADPATGVNTNENQGCSICTEDFEVGQDQRVLPCNHKFHPACVDPWLLNVSGTCPLCRIDLRPPQTDEELEEREDGLAPPLVSDEAAPSADPERASRRRSILFSILGVRRPERLTREQRLQALRSYRNRTNPQPAGESATTEDQSPAPAPHNGANSSSD